MCLPTNPYRIVKEFHHQGLLCAVTQVRPHRHLCGYVRVPPGHPLHGSESEGIELGVKITLAEGEPCEHEDGSGWWFGFDCAGPYDMEIDPRVPDEELDEIDLFMRRLQKSRHMSIPAHYWTETEVEILTRHLADQLTAQINAD